MKDFGLIQLGLLLVGGFGACLLLAVRIAYQTRRRSADELSMVLRLIGWILVLPCILTPVFALLLNFVGMFRTHSWIGGIMAVIVTLPFLSYAIGIWKQHRESNLRTLLWSLAVADEQQMPLWEAARAIAWERSDRFGAYCDTVAHRLQDGVRLDQALQIKQVDASLAVKVGLFHNDLGSTLRRWLKLHDAPPQGVQRYNYLLLVGCALAAIVLFYAVFIAPVMARLQAQLAPGVITSGAVGTDFLAFLRGNIWWVFPVTATPALVLVLTCFHQLGWLGRDVPALGRLAMPLDSARVLRSLAEAAHAGAPIADSLGLLSREYPKRRVRVRLTIAAQQHSAGASWVDALTNARIINSGEAAVLVSAEAAGNLGWGLEELAIRKIRAIESRLEAVDTIVFPVTTLLLGLVVGLLCVSAFQYMTKFIEITL